MVKNRKELKFRLWIDIAGQRFFGPGRAELLQLIQEEGSISKAASAMGMSYKKAWAMVNEMNTMASKPYVLAQKGGQLRGGAELTEAGKKMIKRYSKVIGKIHTMLEKDNDILDLV